MQPRQLLSITASSTNELRHRDCQPAGTVGFRGRSENPGHQSACRDAPEGKTAPASFVASPLCDHGLTLHDEPWPFQSSGHVGPKRHLRRAVAAGMGSVSRHRGINAQFPEDCLLYA